LLKTALAFQGSIVFDLPIADELAHQRMDRVHALQTQGAPYPALVAAHNPLRALLVGNIYYRAYATADGALAIGALSASLWEKVRRAVGTSFLGMADPNFNPLDEEWVRGANAAVAEVEATLRSKTTADWIQIFDREGVPAAPVNFPEDLIDDPQVEANGMMVSLDHDLSGPQRQVGPLLEFSRTPLEAQGASPPLDRDTDEIVRMAGYSDEQIAALRSRGVIGQPS
jgi:crotonobetainyl-CoA:carnitine CoA-transferase CaiB-like acyl-CoA transferase